MATVNCNACAGARGPVMPGPMGFLAVMQEMAAVTNPAYLGFHAMALKFGNIIGYKLGSLSLELLNISSPFQLVITTQKS
jgi:hypothetical protein